MNKPLMIAVLAGALIAAGAYVLMPREKAPPAPAAAAQIPEGATVVTLTKDGYVPRELTVEKGTVVAFVSENGALFWPASNLHPSHGIYPEFDPKAPIQPNDAWSFTFDTAGEWKYHDHLAPYFIGVITVTE